MSIDDRQNERGQFQRSPSGPWVNPQRLPAVPPVAPRPRDRGSRRPLWSVILFVVVAASIGVRAFRDVSRPEAWDYWKEQYISPSLTSSLVASADLNGTARGRPALVISGKIGVASASWLRARLDEAHLAAGDTVLMSSPGGDVDQAIIMGETIRSRGLATAVGIVDASGKIKPSFCASACVLVYAGGQPRVGIEGSALGVHRFVSTGTVNDPVADTQRTTGMILSYLTRMGVSPLLLEAMSQTSEIRWLGPREMTAMNLVTAPSRTP